MNDKSKKLVILTLWVEWFARNRLVHDGVRQTTSEIVSFISGYLREIKEISSNNFSSISRQKYIWRPPDTDFIEINFDSSYDAKSQSAVSGVIVRNHLGQIMGACNYLEDHVADAFLQGSGM